MDPWTPQISSNPCDLTIFLQPPNETNSKSLTSNQYLAIIEGKLNKLKGTGEKEPLAKDILTGLDKLKECQMHSVIGNTGTPYVSNFEYEADNLEQSAFYVFQRKLAPEKQAINPEEVKPLIDYDVLSQTHYSLLSTTDAREQNPDIPL